MGLSSADSVPSQISRIKILPSRELLRQSNVDLNGLDLTLIEAAEPKKIDSISNFVYVVEFKSQTPISCIENVDSKGCKLHLFLGDLSSVLQLQIL